MADKYLRQAGQRPAAAPGLGVSPRGLPPAQNQTPQTAQQAMANYGRAAPQQGNHGGGVLAGALAQNRGSSAAVGKPSPPSGYGPVAPPPQQARQPAQVADRPFDQSEGDYRGGNPAGQVRSLPTQYPGQTVYGDAFANHGLSPADKLRAAGGGGKTLSVPMMGPSAGGPGPSLALSLAGPQHGVLGAPAAGGAGSVGGRGGNLASIQYQWSPQDAANSAADAFNQWSQGRQDDNSGGSSSTQTGSTATDQDQSNDRLNDEERAAAIHDGEDPDDPVVIAGFHRRGHQDGGENYQAPPQSMTLRAGAQQFGNDWAPGLGLGDALFGQGTAGGGVVDSLPGGPDDALAQGDDQSAESGGNHPFLQGAGYQAGMAAGAFPAGMAYALNTYGKDSLGKFFGDYGLGDNIATGKNLLDPAVQAAADAAERSNMQTGINTQRDDAMRMLMGQGGRGGQMGTGAQTGVLNSALRAQAAGENQMAQDQFGRNMQRNQLGTNVLSDAARQKNGIMNDAYTSPGEIANLLFGAAQSGVGMLNDMPGSKSPFSFLFGG